MSVVIMRRILIWTAIILSLLILFFLFLIPIAGPPFSDYDPLPLTISATPKPLLISHRGVSASHPENTIGSLRAALARGYPAAEIDIQQSADGRFFLLHDRDSQAGLGSVSHASEMTIKELQAQPLEFEGALSGEIIPALDSVVAEFGGRMILYLDMKRYSETSLFDLADDIAEFILEKKLQTRALVASHRLAFIAYLEYNHPGIITVLEGIDENSFAYLRLLPRDLKPDLLANTTAVMTDGFIETLMDGGALSRYIVFHVSEQDFARLRQRGVELLMVDDAEYLDSLLGGSAF
ncbi:MAG: glycerophosphodiester phosphodiesterase [Candidatus Zixiibacteriota bacterium]